MNTQIIESIISSSFYTFITVPQDGVKYRFENKTPYTIYICDKSVSSLSAAKSACFASVQAGQMHEFSGRFSAPFCVWTNDTIDFAYSSAIDTVISLTTNLLGESSYVATLPIVTRSDDGGLDNLFPTYTSFPALGTTLPSIDMEGFFGLAISWNFLASYFFSVQVETSSDNVNWQYTTTIVGQSIYQTIPKIRRYFRLTVVPYGVDGGTLVTDSPILVSRLKVAQLPEVGIVDNDNFQKVISSSTTPTIYLPAQEGEQTFLLTLTGGSAKTLVRTHTSYGNVNDISEEVWVIPTIPTYAKINAPVAGITAFEIVTSEATPRLIVIERAKGASNDDDLFPATFSALSTGTTLDVIPMSGYDGLELQWANTDNWPFIQVYSGDSLASVTQLVGQYTCQHSSIYIPATGKYLKLVVTGYSIGGITTTNIRLVVKRLKSGQSPRNIRLSQDVFAVLTVASGATPSYSLPAKSGANTIRLNLTGTTKTLVRINGAIVRYLYLMPSVTERLTFYSIDDTVFTIDILNSEAANRSLGIRVHDPMPDEQDSSDVRFSLVNGYTLTNAAPTQNFSTSSNGWDWLILELSTVALAQARELQIRDDTTLNSYRIFVSQNANANVRRVFRINARAGNAAFTFTAVGLAAGESMVIDAHLAKGLPNPPVM